MKRMLPSLVILFTMLFALCVPGVAYAQDAGPEVTPAATEEAPVETSAATGEAPVMEETPAATEEASAPAEEPLADSAVLTTEYAVISGATNVQFCTFDVATNADIACLNYTTILEAVSGMNSTAFGDGVGAAIKLLASSFTETSDVTVLLTGLDGTNPNAFILSGNSTVNNHVSIDLGTEASFVQVTGGSGTLTINGSLQIFGTEGNVSVNNVTIDTPDESSIGGLGIVGTSGDVTVDNVDVTIGEGVSYGAVSIGIVQGDVTVSNLNVTNGSGMGISMAGIHGDTVLDHVNSSGNQRMGLQFSSNDMGGPVVVPGNLTITNSQFNNNGMMGAFVSPLGNVTVKDSEFNNNHLFGLLVQTMFTAGDASAVGETPVPVPSGSVYIDGVTATGTVRMGGSGAPDFGLTVTGGWSDVTILNSTLNDNGEGLVVYVEGPVYIENVTANNNDRNEIVANENPIHIACSVFKDNLSGDLMLGGSTVTLQNVEFSDLATEEDILSNIDAEEIIWSSDPCGDETKPAAAAETEQPGIVVRVYTDEADGHSVTANGQQGIVFKLMRELEENQEEMIARMAFPASAVSGGVAASFKGVEAGDPAALEDGMTYVGPAFNLSLTAMDGTAIDRLNDYASLLFKLEAGYTVPAGQRLAVVRYDEEQGKWVELSTGVSGEYAYAFTTNAGTFALVTVPVE